VKGLLFAEREDNTCRGGDAVLVFAETCCKIGEPRQYVIDFHRPKAKVVESVVKAATYPHGKGLFTLVN
jgi:hypothetical protein